MAQKADRRKVLADKYDHEFEKVLVDWMNKKAGLHVGKFLPDLKNGIDLCKLINALKPNSVKSVSQSNQPFQQMENLNRFIEACRAYGVYEHDLFRTNDVYHDGLANPLQDTIYALYRISEQGLRAYQASSKPPPGSSQVEIWKKAVEEEKKAGTYGSNSGAGGKTIITRSTTSTSTDDDGDARRNRTTITTTTTTTREEEEEERRRQQQKVKTKTYQTEYTYTDKYERATGNSGPRITKIKCLVLGDKASKKGGWLNAQKTGIFDQNWMSRDEEMYDLVGHVGGEAITGTFWNVDCEGSFDRFSSLSFRGSDCFLMLYSSADARSLRQVEEKFIPAVRKVSQDVPIILACTDSASLPSTADAVVRRCGLAGSFTSQYSKPNTIRPVIDECCKAGVRHAQKSHQEESQEDPDACSVM
ncbi:putative transgelin [Blattamonas nauphoetae]|uniref:Transgelin n=1 Tax=Blattamonas nauphoetae TaxID=2049346 RepID=A0ABQ9Y456_9EUKA|nr:putative transgelin [Blattamonas nauphoetae]